ncbi:MAG: hypothetical protein SGBAC_006291 [Bacillariaceae sp.]
MTFGRKRCHEAFQLLLIMISSKTSVMAFQGPSSRTIITTTVRIPSPVTTVQVHRPFSQISPSAPYARDSVRLTTKASSSSGEGGGGAPSVNLFQKAVAKFKARPGTYMTIPIIAAIVGWFTNYLAVQMIFYPVQFRGIPLYRKPEVPLAFLGWQGIVPCKTKTMTVAIVDMVTSQLLTVHEAFARLDPKEVAGLLSTRVGLLGNDIIQELYPTKIGTWPVRLWTRLQTKHASLLQNFSKGYLTKMVADMQRNIDAIFSLENCVVEQMIQDRAKLGELFRKVGQKELDFLTNSGLWFGFLLGLIQMVVALVWENPWSLSIGGGIVGLATNWLALKWIFEPINPTKVGPFILQGQFLRRQKEVSAEFSKFFADKILASPKLWDSMLNNPDTTPALHQLLSRHLKKFCTIISLGLFKGKPDVNTIAAVTQTTMDKLPNHVHVLHKYIDKTLGLQETLRIKMEAMTPAKFERVLHPIFEEDELTLILAGAVLGFAAGLIQQGIETGQIQLRNPVVMLKNLVQRIKGNRPDPNEES